MKGWFFYFSKSERRGLMVLSVLVALLAATLCCCRLGLIGSSNSPLAYADSVRLDSALAKLAGDKSPGKGYRQTYQTPQQTPLLSRFDPNDADSLQLSRLGLSSFIVRNILRYRDKGGVFRTLESFAKLYGLPAEQYEQLKPYIVIGEEYGTKPKRRKADTLPPPFVADAPQPRRWERVEKYPEGTVVDLNRADTAELKRIPGIGSGYARQIVSRRTRLGGFYAVEQLREIASLPDSVHRWFRVATPPHQPLRVNHMDVERLRSHPYLNFYQAKAIVEHRRKFGKLKSLSQLSTYEAFTEKDLKRLSHYVTFD